MITVLMFLLCLYLPFRLAWYPLPWSPPWWNGLVSWLKGQGWNTCGHRDTTMVRDRTSDGAITITTQCAACHMTRMTISDTEAHWERESQRHYRYEPFRCFLQRWIAPPLREYCRFCTWIGCVFVTMVLLLWLTRGWMGLSLADTICAHLSWRHLSDNVEGQL
jgi:hypothetical protein